MHHGMRGMRDMRDVRDVRAGAVGREASGHLELSFVKRSICALS